MLRRCWSAVRPLPQGGICGHSRCASSTTTVTLRSYQKDCVEASLQAMAAGQRRIAVSLPVGSGKTTVFSSLIPKIPDPVPGARRTLVLAHRTELLEQACARISEQNPSLSVEIEQGKRVASAAADVVVASVPTLGRSGSPRLSKFSPTHFKAIIIDEAHHSTSSTYLRILDHFGAVSALYQRQAPRSMMFPAVFLINSLDHLISTHTRTHTHNALKCLFSVIRILE